MSMLMKCCPFVCLCDDSIWTCPDGEDTFDLVAVDVTLKHTIKGGRSTNLDITNCCLGAVDCDSPRKGITIGHDNDMDLDITYECRFVAYMAPPTGLGTDDYNLGTWTQSTLCDPYWVAKPEISGSWTSEAWTEMDYPCGGGNCVSGGRRRTELDVAMGFIYEEPDGTIPPANILKMTKRLKIAEEYGPQPTPGGVDNPCCANRGSCIEKCIVDVLVSPESVEMEFVNNLGTNAYLAQSYPFTGTTPLCSVSATPDNTDYGPAPTGTALFTAQARMVYEMDGANVCNPPLEADKYAAFDSALPTAWANISSILMGDFDPSYFADGLVASRLLPVSWLSEGLQITASNQVITVGPANFYSPTTNPSGGDPCVYCESGETENGYCNQTTSTGEFSIGTACSQYKANAFNGWEDQIFEYAYDADFACGTTGIDCEPCPEAGLTAYWNSGTANDKPFNQLKTVVTINSITPVHSGDC